MNECECRRSLKYIVRPFLLACVCPLLFTRVRFSNVYVVAAAEREERECAQDLLLQPGVHEAAYDRRVLQQSGHDQRGVQEIRRPQVPRES